MTVEQRERRALELLGMLQERADRAKLINQPRQLPPGPSASAITSTSPRTATNWPRRKRRKGRNERPGRIVAHRQHGP
jgi:hypothetical protein